MSPQPPPPSIDAAAVEALAFGSMHAFADLVTNPEIAERLRGKKILRGSLPKKADTKAAGDLVRWICESPTRKAAHLARLQTVLSKYA